MTDAERDGVLTIEQELWDAHCRQDDALMEKAVTRAAAAEAEVEQSRVQLAGVSVAALGGTKEPAKQGDYGWSVAYQDTLELRLKYEQSQAEVERLKGAYLQCNEIRRRQIASWRNTAKENLAAGQAAKSDLRVAVEALQKAHSRSCAIPGHFDINGWCKYHNIPREFFDRYIAKGDEA